MVKTVLYVDIDGVLAYCLDAARKTLGIKISGNDYELSDQSEENKQKIFDFFKSVDFPLICGVDHQVANMMRVLTEKGVEVNILTARPENQMYNTTLWLVTHDIPYKNLLFRKDKGVFFKELLENRPDIFPVLLDDLPANVEEVRNFGKSEGILYQRVGQHYSFDITSKVRYKIYPSNLLEYMLEFFFYDR